MYCVRVGRTASKSMAKGRMCAQAYSASASLMAGARKEIKGIDVEHTDIPTPFTYGKHRSDAEALIAKVPVIEVAGTVAVCDGGSGALGHPIEYIQLNTVSHEPQVCKYCGLRYKMKHGGHHH